MTAFYPLKFAPLYRTRVWGGTLMGETLRRELPPLDGPVGEAWDIVDRPDAVGFMPRAFDKGELFGYIRRYGVLPRKTFSMGEATEKRYYMEARRIL